MSLSIYSTNLAKNHSSSTSFALMLERDVPITFRQPLLVMLRPSFLSISAELPGTFFNFVLKQLFSRVRLHFPSSFVVWVNTKKFFSVPFFFFAYNIRHFLPNFLKRTLSYEEMICLRLPGTITSR